MSTLISCDHLMAQCAVWGEKSRQMFRATVNSAHHTLAGLGIYFNHSTFTVSPVYSPAGFYTLINEENKVYQCGGACVVWGVSICPLNVDCPTARLFLYKCPFVLTWNNGRASPLSVLYRLTLLTPNTPIEMSCTVSQVSGIYLSIEKPELIFFLHPKLQFACFQSKHIKMPSYLPARICRKNVVQKVW